jgi:ABC-type dipeptide/oligopeptide/nickel transport system ATPase component
MIFQDPAASLNPTLTVAYQIAEVIARHQQVSRKVARRKAVESLELVNINDPQRVAGAYPFQLSGGMQQRVMIAMALSCNPDLLIADEPTTALDVTTQAQILSELDALVQRLNTGIILITHDLGLIAEFTERTVVMQDGLVCEVESTKEIVNDPKHPYTQSLLQAVIDLNEPEAPRSR